MSVHLIEEFSAILALPKQIQELSEKVDRLIEAKHVNSKRKYIGTSEACLLLSISRSRLHKACEPGPNQAPHKRMKGRGGKMKYIFEAHELEKWFGSYVLRDVAY